MLSIQLKHVPVLMLVAAVPLSLIFQRFEKTFPVVYAILFMVVFFAIGPEPLKH